MRQGRLISIFRIRWLVVDLEPTNNWVTSLCAILHAHWNTNLDTGINLVVCQGLSTAGNVRDLIA